MIANDEEEAMDINDDKEYLFEEHTINPPCEYSEEEFIF